MWWDLLPLTFFNPPTPNRFTVSDPLGKFPFRDLKHSHIRGGKYCLQLLNDFFFHRKKIKESKTKKQKKIDEKVGMFIDYRSLRSEQLKYWWTKVHMLTKPTAQGVKTAQLHEEHRRWYAWYHEARTCGLMKASQPNVPPNSFSMLRRFSQPPSLFLLLPAHPLPSLSVLLMSTRLGVRWQWRIRGENINVLLQWHVHKCTGTHARAHTHTSMHTPAYWGCKKM